MKYRPTGFLSNDKIDHDSEAFNYIQELHRYLWRFVNAEMPGASGNLDQFLDEAITSAEKGKTLPPWHPFCNS